MNAAALVLLASGVGVNFGWQSMPEGNQGYEYLVQLEPELAATLAEGQTIPISGEVPDEVRPIGRIRILVGRGELPQQTRTTRFKPFGKAARPPNYRYKDSPKSQAVSPVESSASRYPSLPTTGNFGGTLQQAAQRGIQTGIGQLFGNSGGQQPNAGTAGNQSLGQRAREQADALLQNTQNGLRRTVRQTSDRIRDAGRDIGGQARGAFDKFGQPLQPHSILSRESSPSLGYNDLRPTTGLSQPTNTNQNPSQRLNQEIAGQEAGNRQSIHSGQEHSHPSTDNTGLQPYGKQPPPTWTPQPNGNNGLVGSGSSSDFGRYRYPSPDDRRWAWPSKFSQPNENSSRSDSMAKNPNDSFDLANRRAGLSFPKVPHRSNSDPFDTSKDQGSFAGSNSSTSLWPNSSTASSTAGEINSGMFHKRADSKLAPLPDDGSPFVTSRRPTTVSHKPLSTEGFGEDKRERELNDRRNPAAQADSSQPTKPKSVFPLILSWVLLSGSGAGNLYLFWSYLDVRNKYRSLVRNAARKLGGRYRDLDD